MCVFIYTEHDTDVKRNFVCKVSTTFSPFPLFYDRVTVFSIKIRGAGSMCDFTIIIVINENGSIIPVSNFIKLFKQNVYIIFQKLK